MATPEPEVQNNPAAVEVHAKASLDIPVIDELSKRVDQTHDLSMATHGLVVDLGQRFETHRVNMGHAVAEIAENVADIKAVQAEHAGRQTESERREERRHRRKANLIAVASVVATVASTVALAMSLVVHP